MCLIIDFVDQGRTSCFISPPTSPAGKNSELGNKVRGQISTVVKLSSGNHEDVGRDVNAELDL